MSRQLSRRFLRRKNELVYFLDQSLLSILVQSWLTTKTIDEGTARIDYESNDFVVNSLALLQQIREQQAMGVFTDDIDIPPLPYECIILDQQLVYVSCDNHCFRILKFCRVWRALFGVW